MVVEDLHGGDVSAFLDARDVAKEVVHRSADITLDAALQNIDYAIKENFADFRQGKQVMETIIEAGKDKTNEVSES